MIYKVLGEYHPKKWKAWRVGKDLTKLTQSHGLVPHHDPAHGPLKLVKSWYSIELHAEVRKHTSSAESAEQWHSDGDTTPGANMKCALVLWSTDNPTEFQCNGEVWQPKPFEVVIANNLACQHRRPADCGWNRWTFRQRVALPDWLTE